MELPFKTQPNLAKHKKNLAASSFIQLSDILCSHSNADATVVWVYALLARFKEETDALGKLEILKSMTKVINDWDAKEITLIPVEFTKLLHSVYTIKLRNSQLPIKLIIFESLARKLSKNLTIAHIYLGLLLTPQHQRFAGPLFDSLILDFDIRFGKFRNHQLSDYFKATSNLLVEWKQWPEACAHAKCAVATCNTRAGLNDLYTRATLLQLIAYGSTQPALPGYLTDILYITTPSNVRGLLRCFDSVQNAPSLRQGLLSSAEGFIKDICQGNNAQLQQPLIDALKVAWLKALHQTMPRCLLEQVAHSCQGDFDWNLLQVYNAHVSYTDSDQIIFEVYDPQPSQWVMLEPILELTKRLAQVPKLATPVHVPEFDDDEIVF